jgi:putative lipoprotein
LCGLFHFHTMKTAHALAVAAACLLGTAQARCLTNDSWRGQDKAQHFAVGVALGSAGTLAFNRPRDAFIFGAAVGLAKEIRDSRGFGTCSFQDFAVTALGAYAGAYGTAWIVTPRFIGFAARF